MYKMNGKVKLEDKKRIDKTQEIILELMKYDYQNERKLAFDVTKKDEEKFKEYSRQELKELNITKPNKYLDELLTYSSGENKLLNTLKSNLMLGYTNQKKHTLASDIEWDLKLFYGADLENLNELENFVYETIMNTENIDLEDKDQRDEVLLNSFNNTKHTNYSFEEILDSYIQTKENSLDIYKSMRTYFEELRDSYVPTFSEKIFGNQKLKKINRFIVEMPTFEQVDEYKSKLRDRYEFSKDNILQKHEIIKENYELMSYSA